MKEKIIKTRYIITSENNYWDVKKSFETEDEYRQFMKENAVSLSSYHNFEANQLRAYKEITTKRGRETVFSRDECTRWFTLKENLKEANLTKINTNNGRLGTSLLSAFDVRFVYSGDGTLYVDKESYLKVLEELNKDHEPLVFKGTDWPYWFIVNGTKVRSKTSSWAKYLYDNYNYVSDIFLVPYKGPDKEAEHKDER